MDWRLLTLFTAMLCCDTSLYSSGLSMLTNTEMHEVLGGRVMVLLDIPAYGPPTPHCRYPSYYRRWRRLRNSEVVDIPTLKTRGYRLRLEPTGSRSLTCRLVNVEEAPKCTQMTCPIGWIQLDKTCFLVTSFVGTWEEGHSFCQQQGGTLATVSSNAQQTALSRLLSRDTWIGLKLKEHSIIYSWADGSDYSYTSWRNGDPSSLDTPDPKGCVEMREKYNFQWHDVDCGQLKLCLCSSPGIALTAIKNTRPPSAKSCPPGWITFRSACYKIFYDLLSYDGAKRACQRLDAYLASIHSEEEDSFIRNRVREDTWIGLTDSKVEGSFAWEDGSAITYTRWDPNEPNNSGRGEDCIEMKDSKGYRWNDVPCDVRRHYVCKIGTNQDSFPEPMTHYTAPETTTHYISPEPTTADYYFDFYNY